MYVLCTRRPIYFFLLWRTSQCNHVPLSNYHEGQWILGHPKKVFFRFYSYYKCLLLYANIFLKVAPIIIQLHVQFLILHKQVYSPVSQRTKTVHAQCYSTYTCYKWCPYAYAYVHYLSSNITGVISSCDHDVSVYTVHHNKYNTSVNALCSSPIDTLPTHTTQYLYILYKIC